MSSRSARIIKPSYKLRTLLDSYRVFTIPSQRTKAERKEDGEVADDYLALSNFYGFIITRNDIIQRLQDDDGLCRSYCEDCGSTNKSDFVACGDDGEQWCWRCCNKYE